MWERVGEAMNKAPNQKETAKQIRIEIADLYQDIVDMGSEEFTRKYNQDCLKITIAARPAKSGYRLVKPWNY